MTVNGVCITLWLKNYEQPYIVTALSGRFALGPEGALIQGQNCEAKIHLKVGAEAKAQK